MTHTEKKGRFSIDIQKLGLPLSLLFLIILLKFASEIKRAIILGIKLSVTSLIPALFPFLILSDYLVASLRINESGVIARGFERLFGISVEAAPAFLCGALCGFPLGVKCAANLYENKTITKDECERLIGFTNNPSLAFVVSAVGLGMRGNLTDGVLLYVSVILSAILVGALFRRKINNISYRELKIEQKFDLAISIKCAGHSAIAISSYIIFFSAILGSASAIIKNETFNIILASLAEVGNATSLISLNNNLSYGVSMATTGFALGFSGFSVHMQGFAFLPNEISKNKYIIMKFIQGIICGVLSLIFATLKYI